MQICFVTCASAGGIKGIQVLHLTFSQGTEPLSLFCIVLSSGSPKASPLSQWSSTDPRILLLMSCCTNPTHTPGLSAHTLVLLETFILKKEKRKRTKNESNLSDYVSAAELPVKKKVPAHVFVFFCLYQNLLWRGDMTWVHVDETQFFSNKLHMFTWMFKLPYAMVWLGWQEVNR